MSSGLRFWHRFFIGAVFILFVLFDANGAEASPPKHILFLHAQTEDFPAHKLFENGFKKQCQITGETNFEYSYNYLELTKFSSNPRYPEQLVPVRVENAEYQFDWRALKRWGIQDSQLPPDSKVLFKQLTVWEMHQREILGGVVSIVFLSFLVAALLINRMRRRRAEELLIQLNAALEEKVAERTSDLTAANQELTAQYEELREALANALECRDGVPRQHKARLRFNKVGNRLIVRVKTSRIGFAGNAVLQRLRSHPEDMFSFGEDAPMGRGMLIMLTMSHKMTYNSEGTEVLLAWKL
ncbi:MAG: hypothetical protein AB9917_24715 [Negativicutes bacterium]